MSISDFVTTSEPLPPRTIIYGSAGIGKTTFASLALMAIFILLEAGQGKHRLTSFPLATTFKQVVMYLQMLIDEDNPYRTVAIDSADWLEQIIWQQVACDQGKECIEDIGYAKGYIFALAYWQKILSMLDELRTKKQMHIIVIAHAQVKTYNNPMTEPYDRYMLKLHDKARGKLEEWSDVILFAQKKTLTRKLRYKEWHDHSCYRQW